MTAHEDKRETIIREAATCFEKLGYYRVSMQDIAERVGLRKPTLYHYFRSKKEILHAIIDEGASIALERHERRLETPMTASQYLLELMADLFEQVDTHRGYVLMFFSHFEELGVEERRMIETKWRRYLEHFENVIKLGMENGEFRSVDPRFTSLAILGACNWSLQWYSPEGSHRPQEIAYVFWDMMLRGLRVPGEGDVGSEGESAEQAFGAIFDRARPD